MSLTDELRKLADLHDEGKLTAQEFADAKSRLIASTPITEVGAPVPEKSPAEAMPAMEEKTYWSSRWSAGNLFFRDRLVLSGDGITFRKGAVFSSNEEHINYRAIASI
ncbi:MAG: SHOCT domain-containing protein, partial [Lacunisphaera sp.]